MSNDVSFIYVTHSKAEEKCSRGEEREEGISRTTTWSVYKWRTAYGQKSTTTNMLEMDIHEANNLK